MLSAMPRSMECYFFFLWALEWKNWFSINPAFPDNKKRKPCLLLILFGILRSNFPSTHRDFLDSVPSYTFYPTSYHSESHSITLVILLVELKDWISLSVPPATPLLNIGEKEIRGFILRIQYLSRFIVQLTPICEPLSRAHPIRRQPHESHAEDDIFHWLTALAYCASEWSFSPLLLKA